MTREGFTKFPSRNPRRRRWRTGSRGGRFADVIQGTLRDPSLCCETPSAYTTNDAQNLHRIPTPDSTPKALHNRAQGREAHPGCAAFPPWIPRRRRWTTEPRVAKRTPGGRTICGSDRRSPGCALIRRTGQKAAWDRGNPPGPFRPDLDELTGNGLERCIFLIELPARTRPQRPTNCT
jgi:hypothetical protein